MKVSSATKRLKVAMTGIHVAKRIYDSVWPKYRNRDLIRAHSGEEAMGTEA